MPRVKTVGSAWEVYNGEAPETAGGLKKEDLVMFETNLKYFVFPDEQETVSKKEYKKVGKYKKVQYKTVTKDSPKLIKKTGSMVVSKAEFEKMEEAKKMKEETEKERKKYEEKEVNIQNPQCGVTYIRPKLRR